MKYKKFGLRFVVCSSLGADSNPKLQTTNYKLFCGSNHKQQTTNPKPVS
jgi:hypothetical protein